MIARWQIAFCAIWSLNYPKYLLTAFVICARWTGDIYYPHKTVRLPLYKNQFNSQTVNELISIQDVIYINCHLL